MAAKDTEGPAVIALLTSRSNTIYDQVLTVNVPAVDGERAAGGRAGGVTAPALSTARFDLPETADEAPPRMVPDRRSSRASGPGRDSARDGSAVRARLTRSRPRATLDGS